MPKLYERPEYLRDSEIRLLELYDPELKFHRIHLTSYHMINYQDIYNMADWCAHNCLAKWYCNYAAFYFESEIDAALVKLLL